MLVLPTIGLGFGVIVGRGDICDASPPTIGLGFRVIVGWGDIRDASPPLRLDWALG